MPRWNHSPGLAGLICGTALLAWAAAGCGRDERVFQVRGVVRAPYADGTVSIQHEAIPGFMPAMTMPFNVAAADGKVLVAGDRVEFEFRVSRDQSRATRFRKIGEAGPVATDRDGERNPVRRLRAGDPVPAFSLLDQDDRPVTKADLEGRHTIVSFLFTRCPVPEFCPLLAKKLHAVQTRLSPQPAIGAPVQILTVSIDPEHDRPDVLRAYGLAQGADFNRWRLATGETPQVEALARSFAVHVERNGGSLDHTLATALVGPDGRVIEIWRGNAWKPEEILGQIESATR